MHRWLLGLAVLLLLPARAGSDPPDLQALLAAPTVRLYSLFPLEELRRTSLQPKAPPVTPYALFLGYQVLGTAELSGPEKDRLAQAFARDRRAADNFMSACFEPRHALEYDVQGHHYQVLICFHCHQAVTCVDGSDHFTPVRLSRERSSGDVFRALVKRHGLKVPDR